MQGLAGSEVGKIAEASVTGEIRALIGLKRTRDACVRFNECTESDLVSEDMKDLFKIPFTPWKIFQAKDGSVQFLKKTDLRTWVGLLGMAKEWDAFIQLGNCAIPSLIECLGNEKDGQVGVDFDAVDVLKKIGEPAVNSLVTALGHKNKGISTGARITLQKIGQPAVQPLITLLRDKDKQIRKCRHCTHFDR